MLLRAVVTLWIIGVGMCLMTAIPGLAKPPLEPACRNNEITKTLHELEYEAPTLHRYEKSGDLAASLAKSGSRCITPDGLRTLTRMLRDKDDAMRFWAAAMIGNIGPRARSAIPALKRALAERPCEGIGLNSAQAVRRALSKLGERPPKTNC